MTEKQLIELAIKRNKAEMAFLMAMFKIVYYVSLRGNDEQTKTQ